jgi:hypothetical protein
MNTFLRKISSRKLWIAVVGIVVGVAAAFGIEESEYASVVGVIGAIASCVSYILGEAKIDAAGAGGVHNTEYYVETTTTDEPLIGTTDPDMGETE